MYINIVVVVGWFPACCPAAHLSIFISRSLLSHTVARSLSHLLSLPAAAESVYLMPTCSPGSCFRGCCCCCACSCLSIASHGLTSLQPCMHASVCTIVCVRVSSSMCVCIYVYTYARIVVALAASADLAACLALCLLNFIYTQTYVYIYIRVRVYAWSCRWLLENVFVCTPLSPLYMYICMDLYTYMHMYACVLCDCVTVCSQWIGLSLPALYVSRFLSLSHMFTPPRAISRSLLVLLHSVYSLFFLAIKIKF